MSHLLSGKGGGAPAPSKKEDEEGPRTEGGGAEVNKDATLIKTATCGFLRQGTLTLESIPSNIRKCEYAVRGILVDRSLAISRRLRADASAYPFEAILPANIGNPQAVGQTPITFYRQLLAALAYPALMDNNPPVFPPDICARAREYLEAATSIGCYSHSKGVLAFRQSIAKWFGRRDGLDADPEEIFLTDGASSAVKAVLELLLGGLNDGVLIPIPQYPLYSATIARLGGTAVSYYLDEEAGWAVSAENIRAAVKTAEAKGIRVKALVVINPGNPTGSLLSLETCKEIVNVCDELRLVLLADEVYQENIYKQHATFHSMRKVSLMLEKPIELFSFHSCSKGVAGECGVRGGLVQASNVAAEALGQLYKLMTINLCANIAGQALMTAILSPPVQGEPSFELFQRETSSILSSLREKSLLVGSALNGMAGVTCQSIDGAMYAFPASPFPLGPFESPRKNK
eukprot:GHVT01094637.1.p1 GENE.GHVT01094637.1~~GHVT01094637.1.p1  ORF type:complete len:459 (+),score=108.99 GHVT01094637.1:48-1424(+)